MRFFTRAGRALLLAVLVVVGSVCMLGCGGGEDNPSGGGVSGGNTCGKDGTAGSCKTVTIGGQTWMAENLNYQTGNSWCYKDSSSYCNKYGRLYTWETAKSACQSVGWRLPDTEDWRRLVEAAGGSSSAGKALKSTSGWNGSGNGTDSYGFSALPAGTRATDGSFSGAGNYGVWWTATETEHVCCLAYVRNMNYINGVVDEYYIDKGNAVSKGSAASVRCLED